MNKSQPSQQKPPIPQNPTNNLTTNTITNVKNTKNNRTDIIQPSNNNKTMNKSQLSQHKTPIPQKPTNNLTTNIITNDKNTKNNRTDIQPSNNNKTMNKPQPSQQKPQIPQKPAINHIANTNTNDKNTKNNRTDIKPSNNNTNNKVIWDCGSSLYDSVELDSFRKQIDSAIINSARTLSMPRLPSEDRRAPLTNPPQPLKKPPSSKFSKSFQKLIRSVFRVSKPDKKAGNSGNSSPDPWFFDSPVSYEKMDGKKVDGGGKYIIVYDKPDVVKGLTTIPEVPEVNYSPEIGSNLVRKTMSERFTSASFGIHCA